MRLCRQKPLSTNVVHLESSSFTCLVLVPTARNFSCLEAHVEVELSRPGVMKIFQVDIPINLLSSGTLAGDFISRIADVLSGSTCTRRFQMVAC